MPSRRPSSFARYLFEQTFRIAEGVSFWRGPEDADLLYQGDTASEWRAVVEIGDAGNAAVGLVLITTDEHHAETRNDPDRSAESPTRNSMRSVTGYFSRSEK